MSDQLYSLDCLGKNIQRIRKEKGITRETLSELTDVSSRMVYDWENGISIPKVERLVIIAQVLGTSIDELLTEM